MAAFVARAAGLRGADFRRAAAPVASGSGTFARRPAQREACAGGAACL